MPSFLKSGDYSAAAFIQRAVTATGTDAADTIMKWMKSNRIKDFFAKDGYVREDGQMMYDMYLVQVKTPQESTREWDYYKIVQRLPADSVYNSLEESTCKLVKK